MLVFGKPFSRLALGVFQDSLTKLWEWGLDPDPATQVGREKGGIIWANFGIAGKKKKGPGGVLRPLAPEMRLAKGKCSDSMLIIQ